MLDSSMLVAQATTSPGWVDTPASSGVSEDDAARLSDLLSVQAPQTQAPLQVQPAPAADEVPAVSHVSDLARTRSSAPGALETNLNSIGQGFTDSAARINETLASGELTPMKLIELQMHVINQSVGIEMLSKVGGKLVTDVDQMIKVQ